MLHAIVLNKTRRYREYLGQREDGSGHVTAEDEIGSSVFGPLDFMTAEQVYRFWRSLLLSVGRGDGLPETPPSRAVQMLWPRKRILGRMGKGVEPDGHVTLVWSDGTRIDILIEIKWRQRLYRDKIEEQLHVQWRDYLDSESRARGWHFFIAPRIGDAVSQECIEGGEWPAGRLVPVTWLQLRDVLCGLARGQDGVARWAATAERFLDRIGIRGFRGFAHLDAAIPRTEVFYRPFYKGLRHGFKGFGQAALSLPASGSRFQSFFQE